jgi:hypothetical protein
MILYIADDDEDVGQGPWKGRRMMMRKGGEARHKQHLVVVNKVEEVTITT